MGRELHKTGLVAWLVGWSVSGSPDDDENVNGAWTLGIRCLSRSLPPCKRVSLNWSAHGVRKQTETVGIL